MQVALRKGGQEPRSGCYTRRLASLMKKGEHVTTIYVDPDVSDDARREALYSGHLFTYTARPSSTALIELARAMIEQAFGSLDPETAQYEMPVEAYARVLAELKPKFIHHPDAKSLIRDLLDDFGCDVNKTFFDVPRMRTATSDDYLTTGIAYAFHPHRDMWYSAPQCQLNWWIPIYGIESDRSMAFHLHHWEHQLQNTSRSYDYDSWNRTSRYNAAEFIGIDTREQPHAEESVHMDPQIRVITPPGGVLLFSPQHLHSTVPNTTGRTRFSIDFRTVHIDDLEAFRGAPNIDSECTGTSLGDFVRANDLCQIPEQLINAYDRSATSLVAAGASGGR